MLQTTLPRTRLRCRARVSLFRGHVNEPWLSTGAETRCPEEAPDAGETQLFRDGT